MLIMPIGFSSTLNKPSDSTHKADDLNRCHWDSDDKEINFLRAKVR